MRTASAPSNENYYGIPLLKKPKWGWEIATYFFLEGLSAASFLLASLARLFGKKKMMAVARAGHQVAFFSLLPCPPLLIKDLGRPERFIYMLRVFKPGSPMNAGAWALMFYSLPASLLGMRLLPATFVEPIGLPFAMFMLCYPGVLLSNTSIPVWNRSRVLGALFAASSMNSAIAMLTLVISHKEGHADALVRLGRVQRVVTACEVGLLSWYIRKSGPAARSLTTGKYGRQLWGGTVGAGMAAPLLLGTRGKKRATAAALCTIAGSLLLKWAVTHAGPLSSEDVKATQATDAA